MSCNNADCVDGWCEDCEGVSESIFKCRSCGSKSSDYKVTDDEGTTIHDIECIDCGGDYNYEYCHSCCPCVEVTA